MNLCEIYVVTTESLSTGLLIHLQKVTDFRLAVAMELHSNGNLLGVIHFAFVPRGC